MKGRILKVIIIILMISAAVTFLYLYKNSKVGLDGDVFAKIVSTPLYDPYYIGKFIGPGAFAEEAQEGSKIDMNEAVRLAEKYSGTLSSRAKNIHAHYCLLTDESLKSRFIPKEALEANPKLSKSGYVYKTPVWIIAYNGLSKGAESSSYDSSQPGKRSIDIEIYFIDAETGKYLSKIGSAK